MLLVAPLELPRSLEHVELSHAEVEALLYSHHDECRATYVEKHIRRKNLGVAGPVGVSVTSEVAFFASPFLGNYFLRHGMKHVLYNCCQL